MVIRLLVPTGVYSTLAYAFIQVIALCHGDRFLDGMNVGYAS